MNAGKILNEITKEKENKIAFIFKEEYSYKTLEEMVNKVANVFTQLGVGKGTKVAIYMPNCIEYIFSYFAIFKIGAVAVPLDHRLKIEEVIILLNHSKADFLITSLVKEFDPDLIKKNVPSLKEIIIAKENYKGCLSLENLIKNSSKDFPIQEIDENCLAAIFYTSGTTGIPKGVMWTYKHLDSPMETLKYNGYFKKDDVCICPLPFSHNGGIVGILLVFFGIKVVCMQDYHPLELLHNIQKHKVTFMFLVPTMFIGMVNLKEFESVQIPSLRWAAVFGAPSSPELLMRFKKSCPSAKLFSGYGLTESAAPNVLPPLDKIKVGSVGKVVPWVELKIVDGDGIEVPIGEIGEVIMKGWPITPGYYNQPELTSQIIKDGWLYTGDLGKLDEEGYLYIVGRKKEIIIVGGLNVFAPEVEGVIYKHPKVKEVAVIGVSDRLRGEAVKAIIVPKEGEKINEFEIKNFCRKHLASYKIPSIIEFREDLPKTGSGKIKKELLK